MSQYQAEMERLTAAREPVTGVVRDFAKNCGFIWPMRMDDIKRGLTVPRDRWGDVFFHRGDIAKDASREMEAGVAVEFFVIRSDRGGWKAVEVRPI